MMFPSINILITHAVFFTENILSEKIGHVRYINILTWLRGFQDKLLHLVLFSLYPSLLWELRDKRKKNCIFDPKTSKPSQNSDISNVAYCEPGHLGWNTVYMMAFHVRYFKAALATSYGLPN